MELFNNNKKEIKNEKQTDLKTEKVLSDENLDKVAGGGMAGIARPLSCNSGLKR